MRNPHMNPQLGTGSQPSLAHIILSQLARMRAQGTISDADFESKVERLEREELVPRNQRLLRREFAGGRVRFLIKSGSGRVCDMVEYDPSRASLSAGLE
jgi:hypothetical protein